MVDITHLYNLTLARRIHRKVRGNCLFVRLVTLSISLPLPLSLPPSDTDDGTHLKRPKCKPQMAANNMITTSSKVR